MPDGAAAIDDGRFFASLSQNRKWCNVCRIRIGGNDVDGLVTEINALLADGGRAEWLIGPSATPVDLVDRLRAAGCRDPGPPFEPSFTALATEHEPAAVTGIEVRRIETFDEFLAGVEILVAASPPAEEWAARTRSRARADFERRRHRPGGEWLAYLDGEAVAYGGAIAGPRGLYLAGGATLPEARGRGCYRALIHARWREAVRLGTPALVVHAQETSRPILERCGFERLCTLHELVSP